MNQKSFAYIANMRIPSQFAHSVYVVKTCQASAKLGFRTTLVLPDRLADQQFPHTDLYSYYQIPKSSFTTQKIPVPEINNLPKPIEFFYKHIRYQVRTWVFNLRLVKFLNQQNINIVETYDRETLVLLKLCFWFRPKIIFDVHIEPRGLYQKFLGRLVGTFPDLYITTNNYLKKFYQDRGVGPKKILVSPNGFDPKTFQIKKNKSQLRKKFGLPLKKTIIGFIGRFETMGQEKGNFDLIKAIALSKNPKLHLVLVGGPPDLADHYQKFAQKHKVQDQLTLIPQVKPNQVPLILKTFDIAAMVYPDTFHFKHIMSPMKMIEYLAARLPILTTDLPSIRDIVSDKQVYFCQPNNPKSILKTLNKILKNPQTAKQKSLVGREKSSNYTWTNRQKLILNHPAIS